MSGPAKAALVIFVILAGCAPDGGTGDCLGDLESMSDARAIKYHEARQKKVQRAIEVAQDAAKTLEEYALVRRNEIQSALQRGDCAFVRRQLRESPVNFKLSPYYEARLIEDGRCSSRPLDEALPLYLQASKQHKYRAKAFSRLGLWFNDKKYEKTNIGVSKIYFQSAIFFAPSYFEHDILSGSQPNFKLAFEDEIDKYWGYNDVFIDVYNEIIHLIDNAPTEFHDMINIVINNEDFENFNYIVGWLDIALQRTDLSFYHYHLANALLGCLDDWKCDNEYIDGKHFPIYNIELQLAKSLSLLSFRNYKDSINTFIEYIERKDYNK